jgi:hypothetical protein
MLVPMKAATEPRVQAGWRIRRDLRQWVNVEAAKRQLDPRDVIEQLITAMKELTDAK